MSAMTKKELLRQLLELARYDHEVDPFSNACSPSSVMEKCKGGDWVDYYDLKALVEKAES